MRAIWLGALLLGVIGTPAFARAFEPMLTRNPCRTRARTGRRLRSWFAGDSATLDRVLAGALAAGDNVDGWADRARAIGESRGFAKNGGKLLALKFDSTRIEMHGTVAVMTARYSYTTSDRSGKQDTTHGYVVEIFVREKGLWTHPFWHLAR